jgi:hypothetical protein
LQKGVAALQTYGPGELTACALHAAGASVSDGDDDDDDDVADAERPCI